MPALVGRPGVHPVQPAIVGEHEGTIGSQGQLQEHAREAISGFDDREKALGHVVEAAEHARLEVPHFGREPAIARDGGVVREHLRRLGFANPAVQVRNDGRGTVHIDVSTGRCNLLRIFTRDERGAQADGGYSLSDDRTLYEALPFGESGLFDFDEADRGREDLVGALGNRGFLFAEVKLDFRPVPAQLSSQVEKAITYWVTTGYASQVRGIQFPGAHELSPASLAAGRHADRRSCR